MYETLMYKAAMPAPDRRHALLTLLLHRRKGCTADELAEALEITRSAVHQHLQRLEAEGVVRVAEEQKTGGRPGRVYALTDAGGERFPRQYSWFSDLMLDALLAEFGSAGLRRYLDRLAAGVAAEHAASFEGLDAKQRIDALSAVLDELGYEAATKTTGRGAKAERTIVAKNCVFHELARAHPEVCEFDLGLMRRLLGREVEHAECMVRGGQACVFRPGAKLKR
jgi:DeoR family suf operon transcriptional repressor